MRQLDAVAGQQSVQLAGIGSRTFLVVPLTFRRARFPSAGVAQGDLAAMQPQPVFRSCRPGIGGNGTVPIWQLTPRSD